MHCEGFEFFRDRHANEGRFRREPRTHDGEHWAHRLLHFAWTSGSGDQLIYDSARCASRDEEATPLLLSPGDPWSSSLAWDGRVYVQGCSTPEDGAPLASEGTYRAQLSFAGVPVTSELVFTVIEAAG